MITNSPVEGGLVYNVVYWKNQVVPAEADFPGDGETKSVRPGELRARFNRGDAAEYRSGPTAAWVGCTVRVVID